MAIIGVMSDTHGHLTEMRRAAKKMVEEYGAGIVIHLGDDSTDADELRGLVPDVISVPGIFEERYRDKKMPNRMIKEIEGVPCLITHTPARDSHDLEGDIDPTEAAQDGDAKVVLYGHTHVPQIGEKHGAIYINPGHLNPRDRRGSEPSFAIIDVRPAKLHVKIVELDGGTINEKTFFL